MTFFRGPLPPYRVIEAFLGLGTVAVERPRAVIAMVRAAVMAYLPAAGLVIGLASLLLLIQTSAIAAEGYTLRRLEAEREAWRQRNLQLEAEIAALQSLRRVDIEARQRLGMVPATERKYINVDVVPTADEIPANRPPIFERPQPPRDDSWWARLREWLPLLPGGGG